MSENVKLVQDGKFEFLYIKNAVAYYPSLQQPKDKFQSSDREYSITLFVDDETRAELEDEVKLNKQLFKVGKDKTKTRKIKYEADKFKDVEGLNGVTLALSEFAKSGREQKPIVVDKDGIKYDGLVGNGSKVSVKCFGYRNKDDLLVVSLNLVKIHELVEYTGGSSDGKGYDKELGVSYDIPQKQDEKSASSVDYDDDIPF